jgi:hypothetical protein
MKALSNRWNLALATFSVICFAMPVMSAEPLQATVEFSRDLPPLGDEYQEGAQFKIDATKTDSKVQKWRRVPKWLAGVWHTERTIRKVMGVPVSYQTRSNFISGYQADAKGHIWHPINSKVTRVDGSGYYEYQIPQGEQIFNVQKLSSTRFTRSTRVRVDKDSGRILLSFQQEDIAVTEPVEDGSCEVKARCCVFDKKGKKVIQQDITVYQERIEDFQPIDEYSGENFVKGLSEFLLAEGKPELVPLKTHEQAKPSDLQLQILAQEEKNSALMETIKSVQ